MRFLLVVFALLFSLEAHAASDQCFIALENGKVVEEIGRCDVAHPPYSSFKIALVAMGFDDGILESPNAPVVEYTKQIEKCFVDYYAPEKYKHMMYWKRNQTPESFMKFSVIWFSRYITHSLGKKKFREYVEKFDYGNLDVSGKLVPFHGTMKVNTGLMDAWLGTSLKISGREHVMFIERLRTGKLPISDSALENTKAVMKLEDIWDDWALYGKTGGPIESGWFVGWVEKGGRAVTFAQYVEQPKDSLLIAGRVAKELAKINLVPILLKAE